MQDYTLEHADTAGARFRTDPDARLMTVLPFAAAGALLAFFAVQALVAGDTTDRVWGYALLAAALGFAGGGWVLWRRPGPPPVLRFDNLSRTLRFENAEGRLVASVPYESVGAFETGRYSSTSNGNSYTTHTISVTLPDDRRLRLCRETEAVRDEQLALLRRCVTLR